MDSGCVGVRKGFHLQMLMSLELIRSIFSLLRKYLEYFSKIVVLKNGYDTKAEWSFKVFHSSSFKPGSKDDDQMGATNRWQPGHH